MHIKISKTNFTLVLITGVLICLALFLPLDVLKYLSLEVVGGPPINGLSWMEGVDALGGALSMRILAVLGIVIVVLIIPVILKWKKIPVAKREVKNVEIIFFSASTIIFFTINFLIGYNWWDADAFLGMGPLFFHSIINLVILGFLPEIAKKLFKFNQEAFADSTENIRHIVPIMTVVAFGYGLISLFWHCCSFFEGKMFFFFFIIKLIQLWAMCSFFFKWGLPLFLNRTNEWTAYIIISVLFGFCYPWHTIGFAITFVMFGILLCYLTRKTNSFLPGLILL
ncbi:MAG: CPBP family intramembrane metalloprotease, partial [Candidatus Helarchaeota archaeon]|nr:CPBP family intramembrane metalloprotease [Candidatus Helarchaeota archaeon]